MRATTLVLIAFFGMILFIIIVPKNNNKMVTEKVALTDECGNNSTMEITVFEMNPEIPVGEENFKELIFFIERVGFTSSEGFYKFEFPDNEGNRHFFRMQKWHSENSVNQINVTVACKNDSTFSYNITDKRAFPCFVKDPCMKKYIRITKQGYEEFLAYVEEINPDLIK